MNHETNPLVRVSQNVWMRESYVPFRQGDLVRHTVTTVRGRVISVGSETSYRDMTVGLAGRVFAMKNGDGNGLELIGRVEG